MVSKILNIQQQVDIIVFLFHPSVNIDCSYAINPFCYLGGKWGRWMSFYALGSLNNMERIKLDHRYYLSVCGKCRNYGFAYSMRRYMSSIWESRKTPIHKGRLANTNNMLLNAVFSSCVYRTTIFPSLLCS